MAVYVPYSQGMRLGMGYNSFTGRLCMDDAVHFQKKTVNLQDYKKTLPDPSSKPSTEGQIEIEQRGGIPQIVSYTRTFTQSTSKVMEALDISGSAAIRTGGFAGKLSGGYFNESSLQTAQINFVVKVNVINLVDSLNQETVKMKRLPQAVKTKGDFLKAYGDSYISGFEIGGAFTGVVKYELEDKADIEKIQGKLNLALQAFQGDVQGKWDKSAETGSKNIGVLVNYSGSSNLKAPGMDWDMTTLHKVSVDFAPSVARTSAPFHAIISHYETVRDFWDLGLEKYITDYSNTANLTNTCADDYAEVLSLIAMVRNINEDLNAYRMSSDPEAYPCTTKGIKTALDELSRVKKEIETRVSDVATDPSRVKDMESTSAGYYRNRLPIRKGRDANTELKSRQSLLCAVPTAATNVKACLSGTGIMHNFIVGSDRFLWHNRIESEKIIPADGFWENFGCLTISERFTSISNATSTHVFAVDTEDMIWHRSSTQGLSWDAWEILGYKECMSVPAAVAIGAERIDVCMIGRDNALYWTSWDGHKFLTDFSRVDYMEESTKESKVPLWTGTPVIASTKPNQVSIIAAQQGSVMQEVVRTDILGTWSKPTPLDKDEKVPADNVIPCLIKYVSGTETKYLLFYTGSDKSVVQRVLDGDKWLRADPGDLGLPGKVKSNVTAISWTDNRVAVFAVDSTGNLMGWRRQLDRETANLNPLWEEVVKGPLIGDPHAAANGNEGFELFVLTTSGRVARKHAKDITQASDATVNLEWRPAETSSAATTLLM